ncbi:MAG: MBL fold metallo-hydrolase [bacterium]|nr:MBL fold metallo-hydrolase [bacterium]
MTARHHSFRVGSMECMVLLDGTTHLGVEGTMGRFPTLTEADCRQGFADMGLSLEEADDYFNILLMKIGDQIVLVDAGEGGRPDGGLMPESLEQAGIAPQAVTMIVITHAHTDHIMGLLSHNGEAVFPNATYVISSPEYAFWQQRIDNGAEALRPLLEMVQTKGLRCIDQTEQILSGLTAVPLTGHTPGQIGLLLESDGARLMHMADLLHSPMQLAHPEWSPKYDLDTSLSVPTRRATLQRAADEGLLTLFYHLSFPGLGHVKPGSVGFAWEPIAKV